MKMYCKMLIRTKHNSLAASHVCPPRPNTRRLTPWFFSVYFSMYWRQFTLLTNTHTHIYYRNICFHIMYGLGVSYVQMYYNTIVATFWMCVNISTILTNHGIIRPQPVENWHLNEKWCLCVFYHLHILLDITQTRPHTLAFTPFFWIMQTYYMQCRIWREC